MTADIQYEATLDSSEILKSLKSIDKNIGAIANQGNKAFGDVGKQAKLSGIDIGVVSGIVQELTGRFIELGERAIGSIIGITQRGIELNKSLETAELVFGAAFGDPKLGEATIQFLDEVSTKLNINQGEATAFAQSILPKTGSLDEFTELLKLTDIQADATGQTINDLTFSIREALSGDFVSLKDRFDLSKDQINKIKSLSKEMGLAQAIAKVVGDDFERLGKVNIQGTLATDIKSVQAQFDDLNRTFSESAANELKEQYEELGSILSERGDDFELIADTFGRIVANIIDFVGSGLTDFLSNLDTEEATQLGEDFFDLVDNARTLAEVLGLMELPGTLLDDISWLVDKLAKASETAVQIGTLAKAEIARRQADEAKRAEQGLTALGGLVSFGGTEEQQAEQQAAGQAAFNKVIQDSLGILEESTKRKDENREATKKLRAAQQEAAEGGKAEQKANEDLINAQLAAAAAAEAQAASEEELNKALEKVGEALAKVELDTARARADALSKSSQDRTKIELDFSRNREKDERDLQRKLKEIEESGADERTKKAAEIEKQASQKRVDIQTQFRRQLEDINRKYDQSGLEAEQNRDAIAFLQNEKQRQRDIEAAGTQRDRSTQDVNVETSRSQAELQTLDDALQQKLEKERENFRIRQEEAAIAQQQLLTDLDTNLQLENEKISLAEQRKLEDLQNKSKEELQIIQDATGQQINLVTNSEQLKTLIVEQESAKRIKALEAERAAAAELAAATVPTAPPRPTNATVAGRRALAASGPQFGFAEGGVIPGPVGAPVQVLGHGGEGFLNRGQMSNLFKVLSNPASPLPVSPSASNTSITNNRQQQIEQLNFGASLDLIERVTSMEQAIEMLTRVRR